MTAAQDVRRFDGADDSASSRARCQQYFEMSVSIDCGQLYIYGEMAFEQLPEGGTVEELAELTDRSAVMRGLNDAERSGRHLGLADGVLVFLNLSSGTTTRPCGLSCGPRFLRKISTTGTTWFRRTWTCPTIA